MDLRLGCTFQYGIWGITLGIFWNSKYPLAHFYPCKSRKKTEIM